MGEQSGKRRACSADDRIGVTFAVVQDVGHIDPLEILEARPQVLGYFGAQFEVMCFFPFRDDETPSGAHQYGEVCFFACDASDTAPVVASDTGFFHRLEDMSKSFFLPLSEDEFSEKRFFFQWAIGVIDTRCPEPLQELLYCVCIGRLEGFPDPHECP